ncbi:MAG: chorismate lyase [Burkholderiales bacterium]|nr:chorismate lyase [Burkholderiales bacterium]
MKGKWHRKPAGAGSELGKWLLSRGSLTSLIRSRCDDFSVREVSSRYDQANRDELVRLGLRRGESALVREVYLCCGESRVVFAHSVATRSSLLGSWRALSRLGGNSLGSTFLSKPGIVREEMEFLAISKGHPLYRKSCRILRRPPQKLWARRSLFRDARRSILVTEVFLPLILELE